MILYMFAVQDTKVGAFMVPFTARAKGEAVRSFTHAVNDEKSQFNQHRGDFSLWAIGEFEDNSGVLKPYQPVRIIGADEV